MTNQNPEKLFAADNRDDARTTRVVRAPGAHVAHDTRVVLGLGATGAAVVFRYFPSLGVGTAGASRDPTALTAETLRRAGWRVAGTCRSAERARALEAAAGFSIARGHYEVTTEHLFAKSLDQPGPTADAVKKSSRYDQKASWRNPRGFLRLGVVIFNVAMRG